MKIQLLSSIDDVASTDWNRLVRNRYPFLRHEFLSAMERHHCVGEHAGWIPRHFVCVDDGQLLGAMPTYEKHNSWGEFVFDHAWADAYHRAGLQYYPKLVNAIPFTPATGQRILLDDSAPAAVSTLLVKTVLQVMHKGEFSGLHTLFTQSPDYELLKGYEDQDAGSPMMRIDCQFHWRNEGYQHFDDFLRKLRSKKRKNIKQERRKVRDSGVTIVRLNGLTATEQDWHDFTVLYQQIYNRKYGAPAFNLPFFMDIAQSMGDQLLLVLAKFDGQSIAGALMYHDDTTLYGRHWGCDGYVDSLHFELCYYQGIEFCIENKLLKFDPGAQGEHKIARGFEPTETRSLHWIAARPFQQPIADFVEREQAGVSRYIEAVKSHSPFLPDQSIA